MEPVSPSDSQPPTARLPGGAARRTRALLPALLPWIAAFGFGTGLDQLTKYWAELHVRPRGIVTLIPDVLDLRYVRNPGAFFSLGAELPDPMRRILLCAASVLVLGLIIALHRRTQPERRSARFGLALLASGATGNLIDRARAGEVVDFVHLHAGALLHWAIFNVADLAITAGLCLLVLDVVRRQPEAAPHIPRPGSTPALDGGRR